jgi:tetratricopeptide (TPR) repeat protein
MGLQALLDDSETDRQVECSIVQRRIARIFERLGEHDRSLEHLSLAQKALDRSPCDYPIERAQIRNDIAWIQIQRGNFAEAHSLLQEALHLVEQSDAYDVVASIRNRLGGVAYNQGEWELAADHLRKSITIREATRDSVNLATSLNNLGLLEIEMGLYDSALENLTRSYELKTRLGQAEGIAMALNNLGWLRILRGELVEAKQALKQAQDLTLQIGYSSLYNQVLRNFGELYLTAEDWEQASNVLQEIARILEDLGASDQLVVVYSQAGESALGMGDVNTALSWAEKTKTLVEMSGDGAKNRLSTTRGIFALSRHAGNPPRELASSAGLPGGKRRYFRQFTKSSWGGKSNFPEGDASLRPGRLFYGRKFLCSGGGNIQQNRCAAGGQTR